MKRRVTIQGASGDADAGGNTREASGIQAIDMLRLVLHRKRLLTAAVVAVMAVTAAVTLAIPNRYRSTATILPTAAPDRMTELKGLAGLGGLDLSGDNSSDLFPVILRSHTVVAAVAGEEYRFHHEGEQRLVRLGDYFDLENPDKLYRALADVTTVKLDKKTGVINVAVETEYPGLSQAVLTRYIEELESFNLHKRRSEARDREKYLSRELVRRRQELAGAEDSLSAFQSVNRDWAVTGYPAISKTIGRLMREVEIKNQTVLFLTREYENAKLDVRKDVPIVRILDEPTLATVKSGPRRMLTVLLMGFVTLAVSLLVIVILEAGRLHRTRDNRPTLTVVRKEFEGAFPGVSRLVKGRERTGAGV